MSDLLTIDGVISAETEEQVRGGSRLRITSGLNLPLAGAVLLHLSFLGLALVAPRWVGERKSAPVVHSVRLYNVAEVVAAVKNDERPSPVAAVVRRAIMAPPVKVERRLAAAQAQAVVQEMAAGKTGSVVAESTPWSAASAPVAPVVDQVPGQSIVHAGRPAISGSTGLPAESVAVFAPAVTLPPGIGGASSAAPAAPPEVLAQPLYSANPEPEYPPLARRRGMEGTVVLEVLVEVDGLVGGLALHQSSGQRLLDEAALKGVKGWRFAPGRRSGEPLAMKVLVPVRFALR